MIVVIDDERTFVNNKIESVVYLRSSSEALAFLARYHCEYTLRYAEPIKAIYLDHDLGEGDDIRIVVDFLSIVPLEIENVYVHSQNPTTDWIVNCLQQNFNRVQRISLPELV